MRALLLACLVMACSEYDPPPALGEVNMSGGVFDPAAGPLEVVFSEQIRPETLVARLYTATYSVERELCVTPSGGALPDGCGVPASVVVEPEGVELLEGRRLRVAGLGGLLPFSSYVLRVEAGLEDLAGRATGVPLDLEFSVAGAFAREPTAFEPGMFLALLEVVEPVGTRLFLYGWFAVDAQTGDVALYGCDADPTEEGAVERESTALTAQAWSPDPDLPEGFAFVAAGQVSDDGEGFALALFPFDLRVTVPPVVVAGAELSGTIRVGNIENGPTDARQIFSGSLTSPSVILGLGDNGQDLGAGRAVMTMVRLAPGEGPGLDDILPAELDSASVTAHP